MFRQDEILIRLTNTLRADDRILAAWLAGSFGRGDADGWSDLDLVVVVDDANSADLCARPWQAAGYTTPSRLALFSQFGQPAIIHEAHVNAPPSGAFTAVVYADASTIDWTLIPRSSAQRPPQTRLLFAKVEIPEVSSPVAQSAADRAARLAERTSFFWMMAAVTAKYLRRNDAVYFHILLNELYRVKREVEDIIAGVRRPYHRGSLAPFAATPDAQRVALQKLCAEMDSLPATRIDFAADLPVKPLQIIETILNR